MRRRIWSAILLLGAVAALFLYTWTYECERQAHVGPDYLRKDLTEALQIIERTAQAVNGQADAGRGMREAAAGQLIFQQTGLSPWTAFLLISQGRAEAVLAAQEKFFREASVSCEPNTIISREERLVDSEGNMTKGMPIWGVEDGDILITFCSHTFGWRNGHAAIVIDAEKRLTLEAQVMGSPSQILPLDRWEYYPSFAVLRIRDVDADTRRAIAAYAAESLADIPYRLTAGLGDMGRKSLKQELPETGESLQPSGTQCAHLVWYAYERFGFNLDSDGGRIVTPRDLYDSPLLETIQIYGLDRDR